MSYFIKTCSPEKADAALQDVYAKTQSAFGMIPKVFVAQSIRPDLLDPMVSYVNRLMIETHALPRKTKELIAAYVSTINKCNYWIDAHSAMVMTQGQSRKEVEEILNDIEGTELNDEKTRHLLQLAGKTTKHSYKVTEDSIKQLRQADCTDEEIFEAIAVTSLFSYMDRMADALGAPVEGFRDMVEQMQNTEK